MDNTLDNTWMELLQNYNVEAAVQSPSSHKKKKKPATPEQRKELLNFVLENPELVTHSSTKENEQALWKNLTEKLNAMLPEKSVNFWQAFWKKWLVTIENKHESLLTRMDEQLKKFLKNITANNENVDNVQKPTNRKRLTLEEINCNLEKIGVESAKLILENDSMEHRIFKCNTEITQMKKQISLNKKRCLQLSKEKANFNNKKRKIEERGNLHKE